MKSFDPIQEVAADGFVVQEVREWSLTKYRLVGTYCDIFTTAMRERWGQLVYVDLFAGAGYSRVAERNKVYLNSALIAMSIEHPFTKYILCERDEALCEALRIRVRTSFPNIDCVVLHCDSNEDIDRIARELPPFSKDKTRLTFCLADPFALNLKFSTIRALGGNFTDFLILQALYMDANRNLERYLVEENRRIAEFLGVEDWREEFDRAVTEKRWDFVRFLAEKYQEQMQTLGYLPEKRFIRVDSNVKNLPLYYLSFYSKHELGGRFFEEVRRRAPDQQSLPF